jgi:hypothetical protein
MSRKRSATRKYETKKLLFQHRGCCEVSSNELAQNGLASRAAELALFLSLSGATSGGLCASNELAQNGALRGPVSGWIGGARRILCAYDARSGDGVKPDTERAYLAQRQCADRRQS